MPRRKEKSASTAPTGEGRFSYSGLDRIFHEKARLSIMTSLTAQQEQLSFGDLKMLCTLSDGNLSRHLAVLQEAGFVTVEKEGSGRGSSTHCSVTHTGRVAFLSYLCELEQVLADASAARETTSAQLRPGFSA